MYAFFVSARCLAIEITFVAHVSVAASISFATASPSAASASDSHRRDSRRRDKPSDTSSFDEQTALRIAVRKSSSERKPEIKQKKFSPALPMHFDGRRSMFFFHRAWSAKSGNFHVRGQKEFN